MASALMQPSVSFEAEQSKMYMTNVQVRKGEVLFAPPPRSKRTFHVFNDWFFATREGPSVGPYHSKHEAELAAIEYVEFAKSASDVMLEKLLSYIAKS